MTDYTPTTEEVLKSWLHDGRQSAEFHRWLAEVKAEAWQEGLLSMKPHLSVWPKQHHLPQNPYRNGEN